MLSIQVLYYILDTSCSAWSYLNIYETHHSRHAGIVVSLNLKYPRFTPPGCMDIGIRKAEFTQKAIKYCLHSNSHAQNADTLVLSLIVLLLIFPIISRI